MEKFSIAFLFVFSNGNTCSICPVLAQLQEKRQKLLKLFFLNPCELIAYMSTQQKQQIIR